MTINLKVVAGLAAVAGIGAIALAACGGPKEQDAESVALDRYKGFDKSPNDNNWTSNEIERTGIQRDTQIVNTSRLMVSPRGNSTLMTRHRGRGISGVDAKSSTAFDEPLRYARPFSGSYACPACGAA